MTSGTDEINNVSAPHGDYTKCRVKREGAIHTEASIGELCRKERSRDGMRAAAVAVEDRASVLAARERRQREIGLVPRRGRRRRRRQSCRGLVRGRPSARRQGGAQPDGPRVAQTAADRLQCAHCGANDA